MIKKLRLKFVLINMTIVVAMLLVIFFMVYHTTKNDLQLQSEASLLSIAKTALQPGPAGQDKTQGRLPYFTIVINSRGTAIASGSAYFDLEDAEFLEEMVKTVLENGEAMGYIPQYSLQYYYTANMGNQCFAFLDISSHQATLNTLLKTSALIGAASMVAFLLISILLARWAVKPVAQAWEQQKRFVSDASHELKTPLTVIMSNAELLQESQCQEQDRTQYAENILTMSLQMRHLVEGMLELARADNGQMKTSFTPVELSKLVSDSLLPFEPVFFEKGLYLENTIEDGLQVFGSRQHLQQLMDILLDNAGKYSAPGIVTVTLCRQGRGSCLLTVANPGAPIPQADLKRIFERFYRADAARSRTGSFGLGLSIAQTIVREHQGKIWAESNATGNRFCIQLPVL